MVDTLQLFTVKVFNSSSGRSRSITRLAANSAHAEQMVLCGPTEVVEVRSPGAVDAWLTMLFMGNRPGLRVLKDFYQRLVQCLKIDPSLVRGFSSMLPQIRHARMAAAVSACLEAFRSGASPEVALEVFRGVLPDDHLVMLRNASTAGQLPSVSEDIRKHLERSYTSFRKLRNATIYPVAVLTLAMGVLLWISIKQFPTMATMYASFNAKLPAITLVAMGISSFLQQYWFLVPILLLAPAYGYYAFPEIYKNPTVQEVIDLVKPIRRLLFKLNMAKCLRSLSMLTSSGVHLQDALSMVCNVTEHHRMRQFWTALHTEIVDHARDPFVAATIHQDILQEDGYEFVALLKLAGENGDFDTVMRMLSKNYEDDADDAISNVQTILQPLTLVVVGGIVGFVAVAILMPIANMTKLFLGGMGH